MGLLDSLLEKHEGDLGKLVARLESAGLGAKVKSWIGSGENEPISAHEVKQALGEEELDRLAREHGVGPDEAADELARSLPGAVDAATPNGSLPTVDEARESFSRLFRHPA